MKSDAFADALTRLSEYCVSEGYRGYSLYDSHTSPFPFHRLGFPASFLVNQVVKRSPVNLRPLLGIRKVYNPKGMALFLGALAELKAHDIRVPVATVTASVDEEMAFFLEWLLEHPSTGYSGMCWGYHYPWPKRDVGLVPAHTPSSVVTGFVCRALFRYFRLTGDSRARDAIVSAARFIEHDMPRTESDDGVCFSYLPIKPDRTVNANLLAAEVLAYADHVRQTDEYRGLIQGVLAFTANHQNPDGSWYYSFNMKGGAPKKQIDFHQGYVLESIWRLCRWGPADFRDFQEIVARGLEFYRTRQFTPEGDGLWRLPSRWPVDIHNQAQGIITFSVLKDLDERNLPFAERIARRTIATMQGPRGGFAYQRWPLLTNRVSYMRWNQAWMYTALAALLAARNEQGADPS